MRALHGGALRGLRAACPGRIAGLKDTLEDRSLTLVMFRRRKDEPIGRLGREADAEAEALRDACALACLTRIEDILTAYELAPKVLDGQEVDDRAVDLWAPLLALAMVADAGARGGSCGADRQDGARIE